MDNKPQGVTETNMNIWQAGKAGIHFLTITLPILLALFGLMQIVINYNVKQTEKFNNLHNEIVEMKNDTHLIDTVRTLNLKMLVQTVDINSVKLQDHENRLKLLEK